MKLRQLGEDRLLAEWLPLLTQNDGVIAGAGDDCAVVRVRGPRNLLLLKTDCVVEGVHFEKRTPAAAVGCKAVARALSDIAAMSGQPRFALITLIARDTTDVGWTRELYRGANKAAARFDVAIVGGETSSTPGPICIVVAVAGEVERERCVYRSGGRTGDVLFVTGRLGGSVGGKHLRFVPRITEARWLTANFKIHAMMDLSDGLAADLPRLASASRTGFELDKTLIPRQRGCTVEQAINDGEDYELLFAIAARDAERLERAWRKQFPKLSLTRIGALTRQSAIGNRKFTGGYDHFKKR